MPREAVAGVGGATVASGREPGAARTAARRSARAVREAGSNSSAGSRGSRSSGWHRRGSRAPGCRKRAIRRWRARSPPGRATASAWHRRRPGFPGDPVREGNQAAGRGRPVAGGRCARGGAVSAGPRPVSHRRARGCPRAASANASTRSSRPDAGVESSDREEEIIVRRQAPVPAEGGAVGRWLGSGGDRSRRGRFRRGRGGVRGVAGGGRRNGG